MNVPAQFWSRLVALCLTLGVTLSPAVARAAEGFSHRVGEDVGHLLLAVTGNFQNVELHSPAGQRVLPGGYGHGVDWAVAAQYIEVSITNPQPGTWRLWHDAPDGQGFAVEGLNLSLDPVEQGLRGSLRARTPLPELFLRSVELEARLQSKDTARSLRLVQREAGAFDVFLDGRTVADGDIVRVHAWGMSWDRSGRIPEAPIVVATRAVETTEVTDFEEVLADPESSEALPMPGPVVDANAVSHEALPPLALAPLPVSDEAELVMSLRTRAHQLIARWEVAITGTMLLLANLLLIVMLVVRHRGASPRESEPGAALNAAVARLDEMFGPVGNGVAPV